MGANTFGSRFQITSFGESHGGGLGVLIDGCPAGVQFDCNLLKTQLERRRPGAHIPSMGSIAASPVQQIISGRLETDSAEVLSGVYEGKTLGTPIVILVRNQDARSNDYAAIKESARVGHADDVWRNKFGHSDHRGGGRSSGRETVARVMAGAVAQMVVRQIIPDLKVIGYATEIGAFKLSAAERSVVLKKNVDEFHARFPSDRHVEVAELLRQAQASGESYGGVAEILIPHLVENLGQPVFHKLKSDFAQAFLSVGATNGFELGSGFSASAAKGTEFHSNSNSPDYGGIRGGISTGEDVRLKVSFKPTSSILDVAKRGRHDPCIVTRAIPVLEAMTWLVLADHILWSRTDRI